MQNFAGKVAVITGAASGIGKALTEKCIAEGMHVVMADIEEAVLEKVATELQATTNNQVLPIVTNVAIEAELRKVLDEAMEQFGAVHLLFNNAGVGGGGNSWNATQKDWDWVLGVNLWSVIYGLRVFVPQMLCQSNDIASIWSVLCSAQGIPHRTGSSDTLFNSQPLRTFSGAVRREEPPPWILPSPMPAAQDTG